MKESIPHLIKLLQTAGRLIMDVYQSNEAAEVEWKSDNSPLTAADKRSNDFLTEQLIQLDSSIPVMSEESAQSEFSQRKEWRRYWCLDPLDGTKEFIKRNGQFTINLALLEDAEPIIGLIHVPASGDTFWAVRGEGAFKHDGSVSSPIRANHKKDGWIAVSSSTHGSPEEEEALRHFPIEQFIKAGSALKFCYIASGLADVYFRHGPTMEWDTAAGHVLVQEAGAIFRYMSSESHHYNKPSLYNPSFLVHIHHDGH
jgi:3'(2'), 5'-bisphosphate nucleotidase